MKKLTFGLLAFALFAVPTTGIAAVDASINATGNYSTNTDSQLEVKLGNFEVTSAVSVLTIADASVGSVKSASFLDKSGWVKLTPYQSGSDVLAKFMSDTGFDVAGQRVITLRINFTAPKTYVVGYALLTQDGKTVSSAAVPVSVTGPQVKGTEITAGGNFTRSLKYGSSGADVTALQNKLTAEGFYSGPVTGFYGRLTQAAVKVYQTARGISANGVVGPATLSALNQ